MWQTLSVTRSLRLTIFLCLALFVISGRGAEKPVTTTQATTQPDLAGTYATLLHRAEKWNATHPTQQNRWAMNSEHCLLADSEDIPLMERDDVDLSQFLRGKVIAFVRQPGALDYIFTRLLNGHPNDEEVLAAAQILIYAGQHYEIPDGKTPFDEILPPSKRAREMLDATEQGRFISAEKRWPEAPIREKIENAALRALGREKEMK